MLSRKQLDPCAEGNALEGVCDLMKNNGKNRGLQLVNWVIIAIVIIVGDVLKWFPSIAALFPDAFTYDVTNLVIDVIFVISFFIMLGLPGLISLLKLVDSLIIFLLAGYIPSLLGFVFWIEVIPWFSISVIAYYLYKALIK